MQKVYLILSSDNIGGAEKRFVGLWKSVCESPGRFSIILVISPKLFQMLSHQEEYASSLTKYGSNIIQLDLSGSFRKYRSYLKEFVSSHTSRNDILHFIGDHPLLPLSGRRQLYSITQSSLKNLNIWGKAGHLAGVLQSDVIDVLDPKVFAQLRQLFFFRKKKIFLTSNSFCDTCFFYPLPFHEKKDWFVFLGRFEPMKQVVKLLDAIPAMHEAIRGKANNDLHFYFFGHGSLETELKRMLEEERFRGLPVTISFSEQPNDILARSKVFFSLQWHNNYPSRSLIEAMSAGNIPLVTDAGHTRWLAKPEFSYYVPEHFRQEDLIRAVNGIYDERQDVLEKKSAQARQFILDNHTMEKMRDYYLGLYRNC